MDIVPLPQRVASAASAGFKTDGAFRAALDQALQTIESAGAITLELAPKPPDGPAPAVAKQSYRLDVSASGITISSPAKQGLFYGLQTLRQLADATPTGDMIAPVAITDWPDLPWRGLQLDIARQMTYRHEHVKDLIRQIASLKMNMLHLYLEGSYAFPSLPALHQDSFMTPDQARELCAFAAEHYVTLIPQVNCLGHMRQLLDAEEHAHLREDPEDGYMICPSHPDALPFVLKLVDDFVDAFDAPFIHIGMDEVGKLGSCPRCRARVEQDGHVAGLLADHINAIAKRLREHGRRAMIWGDMLLDKMQFPGTHAANGGVTGWGSRNMSAKALGMLDTDIIVCDWQYAYFMPEEMRALRDAGHDIMPALDTDERVCPWGAKRGLDFHIRNFFDSAKENGALGAYATTWSMYMGEYVNNRWLDFGKTAETLWTRRSCDPAEFGARFCRTFFGMDDPLLPYIDTHTKIDVLPESMRLVPNVMKAGDPWAILKPPRNGADPVTPIGNPSEVIGMKSACLVQCRKAQQSATRRAHLLEVLDIPLRVDVLALRCFHLKSSLRGIYSFATEKADDPLAAGWARDALLTGLTGLLGDAGVLRERFEFAYREYGNNPGDMARADEFIADVEGMIAAVEASDGLPAIEEWCPEPLRP